MYVAIESRRLILPFTDSSHEPALASTTLKFSSGSHETSAPSFPYTRPIDRACRTASLRLGKIFSCDLAQPFPDSGQRPALAGPFGISVVNHNGVRSNTLIVYSPATCRQRSR